MGRRAGTNAAPGEIRPTRGKKASPRVDFGNETNFADEDGIAEFVLPQDAADGDGVDTSVASVDDEEGRLRILPACSCTFWARTRSSRVIAVSYTHLTLPTIYSV